jgi:hypothetical protein
MCSGDLTLPEALGVGLLECFVRQEESRGSEPSHGSDLERALSLLFTQQRLEPTKGGNPGTACSFGRGTVQRVV